MIGVTTGFRANVILVKPFDTSGGEDDTELYREVVFSEEP